MSRFINSLALTFALLCSLLIPSATAEKLTYLIIAAQAEPYQINNEADQIQSGIITDIVAVISQKRKLEIDNQVMPFKRYLYEIKQQRYPNWISYGSPKWRAEDGERTQNKRLSKQALFSADHIMLSLKKSDSKTKKFTDLTNKTVILLNGFDYPGLVPILAQNEMATLEVNSHKSALLALKNGRGDIFIEMKSRVLYSIKQHQIDASIFAYADIGEAIAPVEIHLSYGDGVSQALVDWIDLQILQMKANGEIAQIIKRYQ
ncbi:transporter substrate-binding domain-containing protein [Shewanella sp. KX20019]|uniref:substrate-binding periplasmic protein n=1 Tax=Shewanella sp. KX20019 TaxID=2803864 RepID=UPI0019258C78|nr:transporter substrate-binding domain-containing protein [Shewanella sp. KX20019]QQX78490.1 transporter substrate-binding domain-containing protein [Shewanella sp. KX20019]